MDSDRVPRSTTSHLFTIRVWREELGDGRSEWRGKAQHVTSREAFYFRDWQELIKQLRSVLEQQEHTDHPSDSFRVEGG